MVVDIGLAMMLGSRSWEVQEVRSLSSAVPPPETWNRHLRHLSPAIIRYIWVRRFRRNVVRVARFGRTGGRVGRTGGSIDRDVSSVDVAGGHVGCVEAEYA